MIKRFIVGLFALLASVAYAAEVPKLKNPVNDYAGVLSPMEVAALNIRLEKIATTYPGNPQIMVLTVSKLPEEGIDQYANDVFRSWGIGQKDKDNGVLLVLAPNDRKVRIEVGYGLESRITDSYANDVIQHMKSDLKAKNWDRAVAGALAELIVKLPVNVPNENLDVNTKQTVAPLAAPANNQGQKVDTKEHNGDMSFLLLFLLFMVTMWYLMLKMFERFNKSNTIPTPRQTASPSSGSYSKPYNKPSPSYTPPKRSYSSSKPYSSRRKSNDSSYTDGLLTGLVLGGSTRNEDNSSKRNSSSDDGYSSNNNSSWEPSSSSSSSNDSYSGGGGDSGGGGSSDSW